MRSWVSTAVLAAREREGGVSGMSSRKRRNMMRGSGVVASRVFVGHSDDSSVYSGSNKRREDWLCTEQNTNIDILSTR
jgi:hypothetical protein